MSLVVIGERKLGLGPETVLRKEFVGAENLERVGGFTQLAMDHEVALAGVASAPAPHGIVEFAKQRITKIAPVKKRTRRHDGVDIEARPVGDA